MSYIINTVLDYRQCSLVNALITFNTIIDLFKRLKTTHSCSHRYDEHINDSIDVLFYASSISTCPLKLWKLLLLWRLLWERYRPGTTAFAWWQQIFNKTCVTKCGNGIWIVWSILRAKSQEVSCPLNLLAFPTLFGALWPCLLMPVYNVLCRQKYIFRGLVK